MPLADRRLPPRFEMAGTSRGTLDALEPLSVRNLSTNGMLIESPHPLEVGSIHEFQLIEGTTSVRVRAAVGHVSPPRESSADRYYLVDLEFTNLDAESSAVLSRWFDKLSAQSTSGEA